MANMEKTIISHPSDAICSDHIVGGGRYCQETSSQESTVFVCDTDDYPQLQITNDAGQSSTAAVRKAGGIIVEKETTEEFRGLEFHGQDHVPVRYPPMEDGLSSATILPKEEQITSPYYPQPEGPEKSYQASQALRFLVVGLFGQLNFKFIYNFVSALYTYGYVIGALLFCMVVGCVAGHDSFKIVNRSIVESYTINFVDLSGKGFQGFEANACVFSSTVRGIDMSDNFFSHLPRHCFINNTELHNLDLSRNSFCSVPPAIKSIPNLLHLVMSSNPISYLAKTAFKGMDQIKVIRFTQCVIENIHSQALNALKSLITADFSGNKLTIIPRVNLTTLRNLKHMNFSFNLLESLNIHWFSLFQGVSNISVDDDKMKVQMNGSDVEFGISGNSGTLKCEKILKEIQNADVPIAYSLSCQFENGTAHRIVGYKASGKYSTTSVDPQGDHDLPTFPSNAPPRNGSGSVVGHTVGCVVLSMIIITACIYLIWKKIIHPWLLSKRSMKPNNFVGKGAQQNLQIASVTDQGRDTAVENNK